MRNIVFAYLAGVFVLLLVLLGVVRVYFPYDVALLVIPMYAVMIVLWLYAYRVSRKKQVV